MARRKTWVAVVAVVVLAGVGFAVVKGMRPRFDGGINALAVDIATPFAYVSTPSLSQLPRDLVKAPVLRDLLTEDFVFYYEQQEDRLSVDGALRRIAFEHDLTLPDRLVEATLDAPAEIAWWPDAKGAPRYWLMAMTRNALATTLQGMYSVAASDKQLSVIGNLRVGDAEVKAYALALSPRRTLVLLSLGDRLVVLSDPGLLFDADRKPAGGSLAVVSTLLSGDAGDQSIYRRALGLVQGLGQGEAGTGHTLVADARLLSFGYQHFFPGLQALRLDVAAGGGAMATALRVKNDAVLPRPPADRALWAAVPSGAAACAMLPVDWAQAGRLMSSAEIPVAGGEATDWKPFAAQLEGPAAVCWYDGSQLQTPLFVAQLRAGAPDPSAGLAAVSNWLLPPKAQRTTPAAPAGAKLWQGMVDAPWGTHQDGDVRAYQPTLALQGRWISYSPDDALVGRALDAQAKRFPAMLDMLAADAGPASGPTLLVAAPARIAELLQRETDAVLPANQEQFRQAAEQHLKPRLEALRRQPAVRAVANGAPDAGGWVPIDWQPLAKSAVASGAAK